MHGRTSGSERDQRWRIERRSPPLLRHWFMRSRSGGVRLAGGVALCQIESDRAIAPGAHEGVEVEGAEGGRVVEVGGDVGVFGSDDGEIATGVEVDALAGLFDEPASDTGGTELEVLHDGSAGIKRGPIDNGDGSPVAERDDGSGGKGGNDGHESEQDDGVEACSPRRALERGKDADGGRGFAVGEQPVVDTEAETIEHVDEADDARKGVDAFAGERTRLRAEAGHAGKARAVEALVVIQDDARGGGLEFVLDQVEADLRVSAEGRVALVGARGPAFHHGWIEHEHADIVQQCADAEVGDLAGACAAEAGAISNEPGLESEADEQGDEADGGGVAHGGAPLPGHLVEEDGGAGMQGELLEQAADGGAVRAVVEANGDVLRGGGESGVDKAGHLRAGAGDEGARGSCDVGEPGVANPGLADAGLAEAREHGVVEGDAGVEEGRAGLDRVRDGGGDGHAGDEIGDRDAEHGTGAGSA